MIDIANVEHINLTCTQTDNFRHVKLFVYLVVLNPFAFKCFYLPIWLIVVLKIIGKNNVLIGQ